MLLLFIYERFAGGSSPKPARSSRHPLRLHGAVRAATSLSVDATAASARRARRDRRERQ